MIIPSMVFPVMADKIVIGLGSNLGNPVQNLCTAAAQLATLSSASVRASSVWTSAPEGFEQDVPQFCNAVIEIESSMTPHECLARLLQLESDFGRVRVVDGAEQAIPTVAGSRGLRSYASRSMDLDIIDFGGVQLADSALQLPHPRAAERRFVLLPLQEMLPDFRFPHRPESLADLISRAPANAMRRLTPLIP